MKETSIYSYVKTQESDFETQSLKVGDNWNWSFRQHVQMIFHLRHGIFFTGDNNWLRAFKNIMEPILNLSFWSEDIELKDVVFYTEEEGNRELSFLVKKYHDEVYVRKYNLDELFDEITESDLTYGGSLVQKSNEPKPEVLPLQSIAFCDQTNILGGPIAFKHDFSPDKLREMASLGWGEKSKGATIEIDELIELAEPEKTFNGPGSEKIKTPGKSIEVFIVRGNLPEAYLKDNDNFDDWYNQLQIIAYYHGEDNQQVGVCLYRQKETEGNLKFHTTQKVYQRALGRGVGEALLHPQIWTNFLTIHKTNMLESASKVPLYTDDAAYGQRQKIQQMENLEITTIQDGKRIYQVPTASPVNVQLFERSIDEWYQHGQLTGAANDPMLGKEAPSGTTFRGQDQAVQQGRGIHDRRRGQRAKFIEEIYRDWIIPEMVKEMNKGQKFLASLTTEEMKWVTDALCERYADEQQTQDVLNGRPVRDREQLKQACAAAFQKKGNKHLLELLKNEFNDIEVKMGIDVAGKQKNLSGMSDKLTSIFQAAFANPQGFVATMQIPGMAKAFNDILEYSGISQIDFAGMMNMPAPQQPQPPQGQQPQLPPGLQAQAPQPVNA